MEQQAKSFSAAIAKMERAKQLALDGLSEIMAHSSKPELSSSAHLATVMAAHV